MTTLYQIYYDFDPRYYWKNNRLIKFHRPNERIWTRMTKGAKAKAIFFCLVIESCVSKMLLMWTSSVETRL